MAGRVIIELDAAQEVELNAIAATEGRSAQEFCREAVQEFLRRRGRPAPEEAAGRYAAFGKMIGLVREGPEDASVRHDVRPGEAP